MTDALSYLKSDRRAPEPARVTYCCASNDAHRPNYWASREASEPAPVCGLCGARMQAREATIATTGINPACAWPFPQPQGGGEAPK